MPVFARVAGRPVVVGHRGVRRPEVVENTPSAFAAAVADGAEWVELDARRSADGVAVLYHNGYTPDGIPVVARSAAELAADHGICTLRDALECLPVSMGVNVEVKNLPGEPDYDPTDVIVQTVAAELKASANGRPLLLSSFNPLTVQALNDACPGVPTGLITVDSFPVPAAIEAAAEFGATALIPRVGAAGLDEEGVSAAHAQGLDVMVWTVNDVDVAQRLSAAGVDAVCTDDPGAMLAALAATPPA